jgi:hypothetical protein
LFREFFPRAYKKFGPSFDEELRSQEEQQMVYRVCKSICFKLDAEDYLELQRGAE